MANLIHTWFCVDCVVIGRETTSASPQYPSNSWECSDGPSLVVNRILFRFGFGRNSFGFRYFGFPQFRFRPKQLFRPKYPCFGRNIAVSAEYFGRNKTISAKWLFRLHFGFGFWNEAVSVFRQKICFGWPLSVSLKRAKDGVYSGIFFI